MIARQTQRQHRGRANMQTNESQGDMDIVGYHRVAFILPSLKGGGAQRVVLTIANKLANSGLEVDVVLFEQAGEYVEHVSPRINVWDLRTKRAMRSFLPLLRYTRRRKPLIVISSLPHVNLLMILVKLLGSKATKVIAVEHNTLSQTIQHSRGYSIYVLIALMKLFYRYATKLIAVSHGVKNDLQEVLKLKDKSVTVIYNPVITASLSSQSKKPVRHPFFEDRSSPVIVAAGRLTQAKGFNLLLDAISLVTRDTPCRLIILGEGPDREALEEQLQRLGLESSVSLPGFVANPYSFFSNSDLFVLSSYWEGLPTVLIEALACGTPVVSTDCPSGPKEILENGRLGQLVPVGDVKALASEIRKAFTLGHSTPSLDSIHTRFSEESCVREYRELIDAEVAAIDT